MKFLKTTIAVAMLASSMSFAQNQEFSELNNVLGNKVWGVKDRNDSRAQPCSDKDGGGVKRRKAPIVEFTQQDNGTLKIVHSRFGNGEKTVTKTIDLNQIAKKSDTEYVLKGKWTDQSDSRLNGAYEISIIVSGGGNPTFRDKWQEPGFDGMMGAVAPTELFQCNDQQVAMLGKTDQQLSSEGKQKQAKFDATPDGKKAYLRDKYVSMMTVQDCYDVRKDFEMQYTEKSVLNDAKKAMKAIENNVKKDLPSIDTNKIWDEAAKEYAASIGMHLKANKMHPQNYSKMNKGYCGVAALDLVNSVPQQTPKKDF